MDVAAKLRAAFPHMIRLYGGETTVDHVRAKARCSSCGQKTFEFRIVYRGGSYDALIGCC